MTPNQKVIAEYFGRLEREGYFGTVEVTLADGRLKFTREIKSKQDFEIVADAWEFLSPEVQSAQREKFGKNEKFLALIKGKKP